LTEKQFEEIENVSDSILKLQRAPSQLMVFLYLLGTGKTMTVKEISAELSLTEKATERAVSKLVNKGIVLRSTFREGSYIVDSKQILLAMLPVIMELYEDLENRRGG
jgi:predicted DNA-binding transcriptional regulator